MQWAFLSLLLSLNIQRFDNSKASVKKIWNNLNWFLCQTGDEVVIDDQFIVFDRSKVAIPQVFEPRLVVLVFLDVIFTELVLKEALSTILDLRVKLEGSLCLVDELVLHLECVNNVNDLCLLDNVCSTVTVRHFKLLDLVETLVDLAGLLHEVFQFWNEQDMDLFDALSH